MTLYHDMPSLLSTEDLSPGMAHAVPMANGVGWITRDDLLTYTREVLVEKMNSRLSEEDKKMGCDRLFSGIIM